MKHFVDFVDFVDFSPTGFRICRHINLKAKTEILCGNLGKCDLCEDHVLQGPSHARGLRGELDQIVVVNGSQQGLDLCARLLLDPGDQVVMEDPGYPLARQVFLAAGRRWSP